MFLSKMHPIITYPTQIIIAPFFRAIAENSPDIREITERLIDSLQFVRKILSHNYVPLCYLTISNLRISIEICRWKNWCTQPASK